MESCGYGSDDEHEEGGLPELNPVGQRASLRQAIADAFAAHDFAISNTNPDTEEQTRIVAGTLFVDDKYVDGIDTSRRVGVLLQIQRDSTACLVAITDGIESRDIWLIDDDNPGSLSSETAYVDHEKAGQIGAADFTYVDTVLADVVEFRQPIVPQQERDLPLPDFLREW